uniref:dCMP deaminase n=1 Tax=Homo sapiens TaxID=9606 RepID=D6R9P0_HUMAN
MLGLSPHRALVGVQPHQEKAPRGLTGPFPLLLFPRPPWLPLPPI